jgi:hypothetical protein
VLIGLLQSDPEGQLASQPGWRPTAGGRGDSFAMTDFLAYAGVDPAGRRARDPSRA